MAGALVTSSDVMTQFTTSDGRTLMPAAEIEPKQLTVDCVDGLPTIVIANAPCDKAALLSDKAIPIDTVAPTTYPAVTLNITVCRSPLDTSPVTNAPFETDGVAKSTATPVVAAFRLSWMVIVQLISSPMRTDVAPLRTPAHDTVDSTDGVPTTVRCTGNVVKFCCEPTAVTRRPCTYSVSSGEVDDIPTNVWIVAPATPLFVNC